ncbi:MAG: DUF4082 domain-containing protein [Thermoleophilia bacterium]
MRATPLRAVALIAAVFAVVPAVARAQAPACPCTVFAAGDAPAETDALVDSPIEVGMKFRSDEDGFITGLRFYKQINNTGTHVGHLWSAGGQQLAEATFTNETASGWQEVTLAKPVAINANTTYVTSYFAAAGRFGFSPGYFSTAASRPPLTGLANGVDGGNGVYKYGAASAFPDESFNATNYWVDAVFERTEPADTRAPTVTSVTPADGAADVVTSTRPTVTFDEPLNPSTVTTSTFTLASGASTITAGVSYDESTRTATLTPSAPLALGTTFTATVKGGSAGMQDVAGNPLAADRSWTFSTGAACPCTLFAPTAGPAGDAQFDQPLEVGMKFKAAEDGFISALRFYKQPSNTGIHTASLWTAAGQRLTSATFASETASGWQEEVLHEPVPITKDTIYVVSYYSPSGRYGVDQGYFAADVRRGPLTAPGGLAGGNGVFSYGSTSSFPDQTFNMSNYWVDATFSYTRPPDTRPPRVSSVSPADGQSGVTAGSKVTVTFDEPLDPLTVNTGSIVLRDGAGNPIVGTVGYDEATQKATLTPTSPLPLGTSFTATVKSGNAGVTDTAGNEFAADHSWTFNTSDDCPCTVFAPDAAPPGDAQHDQPLEVGMKFRTTEDGYVTALRFYKQPNNTGLHTGHLWSAGGQLLAAAKFTSETASGWQQVDLPNPVPVVANTTYITSYYSPNGYFAFDGGYFGNAASRPPMTGLANGTDGGNGVYRYGASGFPTDSFNATNYWVDAAFERTIPPDTRGPNITEKVPASGASDVDPTADVRATFDEQIDPASVSSATFTLRDEHDALVPAVVSYDAQARAATLDPQTSLAFNSTYSVRLKGGAGGVTDTSGNPLASDHVWTFTSAGPSPADGPGGPILLVTSPTDRFTRYYAEILRSEGLNAFTVSDGPVTASMLAGHQTVLLAEPAVSDEEVALLTDWVQGGGNLVAMRPDKKLAGLLGLSDAGGTLSDAYLKVDATTAAGAGIESQTLQFHDTADRYTLSGASAIARLYSDAATATPNPAVSRRDVGAAGGQAVAFTYDLARSVVYTRQGNPAWAGQKRDSRSGGRRATDMFFGAKEGDVQPDWVDPAKIDVPQADEQQRLLANLITEINLDKAPLPRFWYLPRGEKAALVLTGDDHATAGSLAWFNRLKASSPEGCSVADWECVRATSYLYPDAALTDAQMADYQAAGFEIALHLNTQCQDFTATSLASTLSGQLAAFAASWPSVRAPVTNRTHCIIWSDWASEAKVERAHGIRFDTNYYYSGQPGWLKKPGLLTGSGFPQRFADLDGSFIDVYQSMTQVSDEMEGELPTASQVRTLLDNALGSKAYYGVLDAIFHSDLGDHSALNNAVAEAQERGVPIVSSAQMLDWLDGRNGSSFGDIAYADGRLSFSVRTNSKARGLEAMLPAQGASGPLVRLTRDGEPVSHHPRTVKGVRYEVFKATAGSYSATYASDTVAPEITAVSATADAEGRATVKWTTDEQATSLVEYGRTSSLGYEVQTTAPVTDHSIELTGLSPATTYRFRVSSTDAAGNTSQSPAAASAPATLALPAGTLVDTRTSEFAAGSHDATSAGASLAGSDGELQLRPAIGEEFESSAVPSGWLVSPWFAGGGASVSGGGLYADSAAAYPSTLYEAGRVLEFSATFRPVNDQAVGFGVTLSDFPFAAFTTGNAGQPFAVYAHSGAGPASEQITPLPEVALNVPHRFKVVWNASNVQYYVDGALVATHDVQIDREMRPVVTDYGLFGAGVRAHWLRQGAYSTSGQFTSRVLDSGPDAHLWQTLSTGGTLPSATAIAFQTRTGATKTPDASWSAWQALGADGAIVSPAARYIQYRATLTSASGLQTPTLDRTQISFGASVDRAPVEGSVAIAPASPRTDQTLTATPSGFSDPDGDPITYHYEWLRNGTPIAGATATSLDLAQPSVGDRGDTIKVRVYATDGRGAASDAVAATVTVANTAPTAGTVTITPATPSSNDTVKANASGYADVDGDELSYRYQWLRNGTAISGATNRTLDLALAGNGDLGDTIAVDVVAVDSGGASSPAARGSKLISGLNSTPVEGSVAITPSSPRTDQTLTATPSGFSDPDGHSITYAYRWLRDGTPISGATGSTLDLATAGNGDRGDRLTVEVTAADPLGATSDPATTSVTVLNSAPTAGSVSIKPTSPATNDTLTAVPKDFADIDGDALTYTYQWYRNGAAISGAIGRTLDLAQPGNGDLDDAIAVDVTALDGAGGTSPASRGSTTITSTSSNPVASYGFEEAAGTSIIDGSGPNDGTLENGVARSDAGRFGRALNFDATDDIATVPDSASLQLSTGMTLEAWVRPTAVTDWRTVVFKEAGGGLAYALYSNDDQDHPSTRVNLSGDTGAAGTSDLPPNAWSHLAATYDGTTLRLFVDGTQVGSTAVAYEIAQGAGPLTFGANNVFASERFRGLIDEVRVYNRALTAAEIAADMSTPVVAGTPAPPDDTSPSRIGQFGAVQEWPIVPVHLSMTSDGLVAAWDGFEAAVNSERRWIPATGTFEQIASGRNLFCAGHITLSDGRLLVAGGHLNAYEGTTDTNLFTPSTATWQRGTNMSRARWYPTVTGLPDGRVFTISGDGITLNEAGQSVPLTNGSNSVPEIYNPANDTWSSLPSAERRMALYPFMFVLPDGRLFDAGPDTTSRTLDLSTGQWTTVGTSQIDGMSAVMYRPGRILKSGTWADPEFPGLPVTNRAVAIDMTASNPSWQEVAPMEYKRSYHTLTALPDGKVLASGGQTASDGVDERTGILATEIWDPATNTWTTTASHRRPRLYHSTSLLLPDGRVLLAGGGAFGTAKDEKNAEIYSPPYLFKGARPTVSSAPSTLRYDEPFTLGTPEAEQIDSVSLIRMGSVTHNLDMDQRFMHLNVTSRTSTSLTVAGPANANVAPPGYYMVFLVNGSGVPSVGQIVKVESATDTTRPGLRIEQDESQADPTSTTPIRFDATFTESVTGFSAADVVRGGTATGGTVSVTGSGANYTITVSGAVGAGTVSVSANAGAAQDAAGNLSFASASSDNTVTMLDETAPTVTLTAPANGSTTTDTTPTLSGAAGNATGDSTTVTVRIWRGTGTDGELLQTLTPTRSTTAWSATAAALGQGTYTAQATQTDASGNVGTSSANSFDVNAAPTVTVNQHAAQDDPTNAPPIRWTVTFSEPVTGFTAGDLSRTGSSTGGTVAVSGSGADYEIAVSGSPTNGTLAFTLPSGRAQDATGQANLASTSSDNTVTYDTAAPAVTLTTPANGSTTGDTTPALSGAAGNAATDSQTVTVRIYSGASTAGALAQILTATRTTTTWTATASELAGGVYTAQATQTDAAGNTGTSAPRTFTIDTVAPVLTSLEMLDTNANGKVNQVRATFSETLQATTDGAPWTLSGVPSNGTLAGVSRSANVVTLTIAEGAGAADTAVGSFTIALAPSASGVRDLYGNVASFASTAPADKSRPVLVSAQSSGTTTNLMQAGDSAALTFSEALAPASIPGAATVTESRGGLFSGSTLTIPGFIASASISNSYLGGMNSSGTANSTAVSLGNGGRTVTLTLGALSTTGRGVARGSGGASLSPNAAITDLDGNGAAPTARNLNPLF